MKTPVALTALALVLAACASPVIDEPAVPAAPAAPVAAAPAAPAVDPAAEDRRLMAFLDAAFDEQVAMSPQFQTSLGMKTNYDRLDDYTPAADERELALMERQLADLRRQFDPARLSDQGRVSYRLFEYEVEQARKAEPWREHGFVFTANSSPAGSLPVFLINNHRVDTVADAEAYVARLREVERVGGEIAERFDRRAAAGVVPPMFVFEPALGDARKVITGAPFDSGPDTAIWADFKGKVEKLQTDAATKARLLEQGRAAMTGPFRSGIQRMIASLERVRPLANSNAGVWRLPNGDAYYGFRVQTSTTTDLTPDQIHQTGLAEVARIHGEMEQIKRQVGFTGTLQQFFQHLKDDPRFEYPNTPAGREQYLADSRRYIAQVMERAPQYFHRLPKAPLEVRAVEAWREATASVAFYNRGTPDGSRPGIYYVNLADMRQVLKPQTEGIAYHEGAPGHHFQISFAQEQGALPKFRRFGGYGAYSEGWGLYAEKLGKEMGFYQDPYSDFGRLSLELWRAARLVTDTGLHAKRWSREQAMDYFRQNTLLSDLDIQREVDRYITNPGQATSYKIGQLKILELRERARRALGPRFDIRDFHEVVLGAGGLPLDVLEQQVDAWIAEKRAG
jgi:uncharacterized protein (DUF885 family)